MKNRKLIKYIIPVLVLCMGMATACGNGSAGSETGKSTSEKTASAEETGKEAAVTPETTKKAAASPTPTAAVTPKATEIPAVTEEPEPTETPEEEITEEEVTEEETPAEEQPSEEQSEEEQPAEPEPEAISDIPLPTEETVMLDPGWEFAEYSVINSGAATLFRAQENRKNIVVGVNAGHGTSGGSSVYTQCHPDGTPKVTGGTTAEGSTQAVAVSSGMTFYDGTPERDVTLREAQILKDLLLADGYDVLMIRNSDDVQLDNIARTVICNNKASCHIAIHWDGDGLDYDKGCFYMAVPDGLKGMYPVSEIWQEDDRLGESLIAGLAGVGAPIMSGNCIQQDLTQTSYSKVPSVDVELGNAASDHSDEALTLRAQGLLAGVNIFFGFQ